MSIHAYEKAEAMIAEAEAKHASAFHQIDQISAHNTARVLRAFANHRVSSTHFTPTTGYGYDDAGRDTLSAVFADALGAPAAIVRSQFFNGTHTIACALYGLLRPGDMFLCATGLPYDTLRPVLYGETGGSLKELGVNYCVAELCEPDGSFDAEAHIARVIAQAKESQPKAALIQRSRGYDQRPTLSVSQIEAIGQAIKSVSPHTVVIVDNCYGEFTEAAEPNTSGPYIDLLCGSLIKNPGGGLAPTGGYVAGKEDYVELAACRLCVPGIGSEGGCNPAGYRLYYQGLFFAPHVVAQALKVSILASEVLSQCGFAVSPAPEEVRHDIIQTVTFYAPEPMLAFMQGIQSGSPVDSYATPIPDDMPGYHDPVVMAAGTFVQGASIELSADGPIRPPYTAFLQGALTYESGRYSMQKVLEKILSR